MTVKRVNDDVYSGHSGVLYMQSFGAPRECPGIPGAREVNIWGHARLPGAEHVNVKVRLYGKGETMDGGRRAERDVAVVSCLVGTDAGAVVLRNKNLCPGRSVELEPTSEALLGYLNRHLGTKWDRLVVETHGEFLSRVSPGRRSRRP